MVIDYKYEPRLSKLRMAISVVVYPIKKVVDTPVQAIYYLREYFSTHNTLFSQNQAYKEELLMLHGKLQRLEALETENLHLRKLTASGAQASNKLMIANIINIDPDPFTRQIIIDKGENDGAYSGQVIIDSDGIMGTITSVDKYESKVLLITDASHAVPVESVRNGLRAIAVGTGSGGLELRHVPNMTDITVGDTMITSGLGGRFPVGFPVGVVTDVKQEANKTFATIILKPSAKLDRGRHILLLQKGK